MNQLGNYDFCTTKTREYALRTFYSAFLLPVASAGLGHGVPSLFIRLVGNIFCFCFERKNTEHAVSLLKKIENLAGNLI